MEDFWSNFSLENVSESTWIFAFVVSMFYNIFEKVWKKIDERAEAKKSKLDVTKVKNYFEQIVKKLLILSNKFTNSFSEAKAKEIVVIQLDRAKYNLATFIESNKHQEWFNADQIKDKICTIEYEITSFLDNVYYLDIELTEFLVEINKEMIVNSLVNLKDKTYIEILQAIGPAFTSTTQSILLKIK